MQRSAAVALVLLLVAVPLAHAQDDTTPIYADSGPYTVGTQDFVIEDAARPLNVTVWYPAQAGGEETARYQVLFLSLEGQALRDAAPDLSGGPYPLVIFSHGLGGMRFQSIYLTEHLASYGFVVIAADHPGSTLTDLMAQGGDPTAGNSRDLLDTLAAGSTSETLGALVTRAKAFTGIATSFAQRPLEVLRELDFADRLTAPGGALEGVIDTSRTAVMGHSFGGYTTLAAAGARFDFAALDAWCQNPQGVTFDPAASPPLQMGPAEDLDLGYECTVRAAQSLIAAQRGLAEVPVGLWPPTTDPRIKAAVALAPSSAPTFGAEGLAAIDIPLMVEVGSADAVTVPEQDAYFAYLEAGSPEKMLVVYEGAGHLLFVGKGLLVDDQAWDPDRGHALINHFTTAFLLATLRDDAQAALALAPEAVDFAGVNYLRQP